MQCLAFSPVLKAVVLFAAAASLLPLACASGSGPGDLGSAGGAGGASTGPAKSAGSGKASTGASGSGAGGASGPGAGGASSGAGGVAGAAGGVGAGGFPVGAGGAGTGGASTTTASGGGAAVASSSSGPMTCDNNPNGCGGCVTCADTGSCASEWQACLNSPQGICQDYMNCAIGCAGDSCCLSNCDTLYLDGSAPYHLYIGCLCPVCMNDCVGQKGC